MRFGKVFWEFLWLGCISFGGPAAHVGYFHRRFVVRLGWLDEATYARLLALTQFLPGPASSQLGFAIGRHRGGLAGGVAAFLGFTLPSFLIMVMVALYATRLPEAWLNGLVTGLKWLAVVVVADAVLNLGGKFCRDRFTRGVALATPRVKRSRQSLPPRVSPASATTPTASPSRPVTRPFSQASGSRESYRATTPRLRASGREEPRTAGTPPASPPR